MKEIWLGFGGGNVSGEAPIGKGDFPGRGDLVDGVRFFGEVPTTGFINGEQLAAAIGLTSGTVSNTYEPWLHFEMDDQPLYVAKKPFRRVVSWDQINAQGAAYGEATVVINGLTYKVRLMTGANEDPTYIDGGINPIGTDQSEWDRLMYKVHNGDHSVAGNSPPVGYWLRYSDEDLWTGRSSGHATWCQETYLFDPTFRIVRGGSGITACVYGQRHTASSSYGWRPVLELVE